MDALNDDIVISILSYLDLNEQQNMLGVHSRFYNLMSTVWRLQYKSVQLSLFETKFSTEYLHHFFQSIHKTVEEIRLRMMSFEEFNVLTTYEYPNVHTVRLVQAPSYSMTDTSIIKIQESFPNLKNFSPHGNFYGEQFASFASLESLTLSYCSGLFKIKNLVLIMKSNELKEIKLGLFDKKIIESSNCALPEDKMSKLELIQVDCDELSLFEEHFDVMPNLKKLVISAARHSSALWNLFSKLTDANPSFRNIKVLESCHSRNILNVVAHHKLNVKILKIVTGSNILQNMPELSTAFMNITQLYFKSCCIEERSSFDDFWEYILMTDFVSFEQCKFLFNKYEFMTLRITTRRHKKLEINLYDNIFYFVNEPWIWMVNGQSKFLKFTEGKNYQYTYEPIYVEFK